eukprot:CAMPEP_0170545304 /NCGR_PEP_ID=MMETSP0211-20121228/3737_1 /TAXON_ID=311385 /ORGANISM="Pseudokeronopsis sp., Strain OXSARD2" /LENGTH=177 /DNA_ID=CAMNT_0010849163 /DNA_START=958 /DNA_END=1488 /DNA_ORIENTATION=-
MSDDIFELLLEGSPDVFLELDVIFLPVQIIFHVLDSFLIVLNRLQFLSFLLLDDLLFKKKLILKFFHLALQVRVGLLKAPHLSLQQQGQLFHGPVPLFGAILREDMRKDIFVYFQSFFQVLVFFLKSLRFHFAVGLLQQVFLRDNLLGFPIDDVLSDFGGLKHHPLLLAALHLLLDP